VFTSSKFFAATWRRYPFFWNVMLRQWGNSFPTFRDEYFVSKRRGQVIDWFGFMSQKNGYYSHFIIQLMHTT